MVRECQIGSYLSKEEDLRAEEGSWCTLCHSEVERVNIVKLMIDKAGWEAAEEQDLVTPLFFPVIMLCYYSIILHSNTVVCIKFFSTA